METAPYASAPVAVAPAASERRGRRPRLAAAALTAAALALGGCGDGEDGAAVDAPTTPAVAPAPPQPSDQAVEFPLTAVDDGSRRGSVFLWPYGRDSTRVLVTVDGDPTAVYPAEIREGPCGGSETTVFQLPDVSSGFSDSAIDFEFGEFGHEPHSVVILDDPNERVPTACATVEISDER